MSLSLEDEKPPICGESALSHYVKQLLLTEGINTETDSLTLDAEGIIDFQYLNSLLTDPVDSQTYFISSVKSLAAVFTFVEKSLTRLGSVDAFKSIYGSFCSWTAKEQTIAECFCYLKSDRDAEKLVALLLLSAVIERALGDVYTTVQTSRPCPSMLKDLLVTPELENLFGKQVIQVLRILIGPPISMNLRNIAWHGFPFTGEVPDRYIWFLLLILPSLGKVLERRGITVINHREPVNFSQSLYFQKAVRGFPVDICTIYPLYSPFIPHKSQEIWETVNSFYQLKRYGPCAALLLCQLEQGLRRLFVQVNNCPDRLLTAESTTLYTTFDEILDQFLPNGTENQLSSFLGEPVMDLLMDLLMYPDGPRVRDRLSHGEADWDTFPCELTQILIKLVVILADMAVPDYIKKCQDPEYEHCLRQMQINILDYECQFHRIALIKEQIQHLCDLTSDLNETVKLTSDLEIRDSSFCFPKTDDDAQLKKAIENIVDIILQHWSIGLKKENVLTDLFPPFSKSHPVMDLLLSKKISVLYKHGKSVTQAFSNDEESAFSSRAVEAVGLLLKISQEFNTILMQIHETVKLRQDQFEKKQLRSRQRDNLKKLLSCCPSYYLSAITVCFIVLWQLYSLDAVSNMTIPQQNKLIRMWKNVLQFSENLRTSSSAEKNKWIESLSLMEKHFVKFETEIRDLFSLSS
ncbi:hypothetical protein ACJMK2_037591 [Sinanodonta woodiana]|uniref:DUF4209 domain-containing protein n=1 Tax=Sinanodonta woodiana TaxID=1069815 RepID=A0ABD3WPF5_SINWO